MKGTILDRLYNIQKKFIHRIGIFDDDMYYQIFCLLAIIHTGINIVIMSFLKAYPPLIISAIGFILCIIAGIARDQRNTTIIYFAILIYGIVSLIGTAYCLDERLGFQNYLFTLIPISLVLAHSKVQDNNRTFHIASATLIMTYLSRFLYLRINLTVMPYNVISEWAMTIIELRNSFEIMVMLFLCVFAFSLRFDLINQELSRVNSLLDKASKTDALTELHNRRFLNETFGKSVEKMSEFHVLLCDIDNFKQINDAHGHVVGDFILKRIAKILRESISDSDYAVRWGGEEFILIVQGRSNEDITNFANRLLLRISEEEFIFEEEKIHITITIGIAKSEPKVDYETIIRRADNRMLSGKSRGKNIYIFEG